MRPALGIPFFALLLMGCDPRPEPAQVTVEEAWVQLPAVKGRPGAAYFTLRTAHDATRLTGVASPRVERVELHESRMDGGVMRMGPLQDRSLAGGVIRFAPGGKHAMLFGLDSGLRAGDRIPLTFSFDPAPPVTVEAEVRAFTGGHAGH